MNDTSLWNHFVMSSINIDHHIFHFSVIFLFEGVVVFCKKTTTTMMHTTHSSWNLIGFLHVIFWWEIFVATTMHTWHSSWNLMCVFFKHVFFVKTNNCCGNVHNVTSISISTIAFSICTNAPYNNDASHYNHVHAFTSNFANNCKDVDVTI